MIVKCEDLEELNRSGAIMRLVSSQMVKGIRFKIMMFFKKFKDASEVYDAMKMEVFDKYAEKDDRDQVIFKNVNGLRVPEITPLNWGPAEGEIIDLGKVEIEIAGDKPKLSNKVIPETVTASDLVVLSKVIEITE